MTKAEATQDPRTPTRRPTLTQASRAARGRYPANLLSAGKTAFATEVGGYLSPEYSPELHVLDSEWYFTPPSSALLGAMVAQERPCLLGTPTVAAHVPSADYVLVDRSPYLSDRFPSLPTSRLRSVDVQEWPIEPGHGAIVLDPPWYLPELEQWLNVALKTVELGGMVLFPLLGEQTRPTAEQERDRVLKLFDAAGSVEVVRDAVEYDIPLFEARALSAAGAMVAGPWRRADLAVARVSRRPRAPVELAAPRVVNRIREHVWETFLIGAQVVKLRSSESGSCSGDHLLELVDGMDGFTLDSVSRRDPRIRQIDIWSSRNRVARVVDNARLTQALRITGSWKEPVNRLADALLAQGLGREHIDELFDFLELIDGD